MKNIENKETKLNAGEALKILENKSFNETLPVIEERVREIISELSENETKIIARKLNLDFVNLLSEKGFDFRKIFESKVKVPIGGFEGTFIS